jgi:hypothetical protein
MSKFKQPKRPSLKKYPSKPKRSKGGIKTQKQLEAWEAKVKVYTDKCKEIDKENNKKLSEYNKKASEVQRFKQSVIKEKQMFKNRLEKVNKTLSGLKK